MRVITFAVILLFGLTCLDGAASEASPMRRSPLRQQLVGAWRLVAIEYAGAGGESADPFYQAGSSGIIIYDSSGWMSVQIGAPNRVPWDIPAVRVPGPKQKDAARMAQAFATYYSYYGTWDYDAARSIVTHHLASSLIPAELGMDYAQTVTLEGDRLVFTVRSGALGAETVRRKIWERLIRLPDPATAYRPKDGAALRARDRHVHEAALD